MSSSINRRTFLGAAAATGLTVSMSKAADTPVVSEKISVAIIGTGGRGMDHIRSFCKLPGVTVTYVCDVDSNRAGKAAAEVEKIGKIAPKMETDLRKVFDDKSVDAVVIATCNHWHAPATILACAAGKHVYVEKPCSHNPWEGEMMVQAARKHKRLVQMGNQRRSWEKVAEIMKRLQDGVIGRTYLAQAWYTNARPSIGKSKPMAPPMELNYALWQGPAPAVPFHSNYLHYNWHWFWNCGNGELGNNGIHTLDLCRWGLGVDYPIHVSSSGGRYRYEDDQQTPDTHVVGFDFPEKKSITWEGLSCNNMPDGQKASVIFYGDKGSLRFSDKEYTIHDPKGKEIEKTEVKENNHAANFIASIRGNAKLNSEIEEGHKSTMLCHLGNIAHRTGRTLKCSPKDGTILDDKEAMSFWKRAYEKGWEPAV